MFLAIELLKNENNHLNKKNPSIILFASPHMSMVYNV
jgi:hypothetical protein